MIYILIVLWFGTNQGGAGKAALSVEFNSLEHCQAAASEIRRQAADEPRYRDVRLLCAEKGGVK